MDELSSPRIIYDFNPYSLPTEYLSAIGLVISSASQTEEILQELIGALLGIDYVSACALGAHISTPLKRDILKSIAELRCPSVNELDHLDDLLDTAFEAINKRNVVAHSRFCVHPENAGVYRLKQTARGRFDVDFEKVEIGDLLATVREVYEAGLALTSFMHSRGISPAFPAEPLPHPINRKKKAREARREEFRRKG